MTKPKAEQVEADDQGPTQADFQGCDTYEDDELGDGDEEVVLPNIGDAAAAAGTEGEDIAEAIGQQRGEPKAETIEIAQAAAVPQMQQHMPMGHTQRSL